MGKESSMKNLDFDVQNILKNEYVCWGLRIILVLYAAMVAPNLNRDVSSIFDNVIVRLIVACVIVFLSFHDTTLAILLSIAFVVSIQTLNKHKVNTITSLPESFLDGTTDELMNNSMMDDNMNPRSNENFIEKEEHGTHPIAEGVHPEGVHLERKNESFTGNMNSEHTGIPHPERPLPEEHLLHTTEGFTAGPHSESQEAQAPSVCGGPNNQFTTQAQLHDAANNLVNKNQVNSVATFCPELNAQGSNPPQGFGNWGSTHAVF